MSGLYAIRVTGTISAAHRLPGYAGPCATMHGHNFIVTAELGARRLENGMVVDFLQVKAAMDAILGRFDHTCLNDHPELDPPTAEVLAGHIFGKLRESLANERLQILKVTVEESEGLAASYAEDA